MQMGKKPTLQLPAELEKLVKKGKLQLEFPTTDAGNAELFARVYQGKVKFDHKRQRWMIFGGHFWREDTSMQAQEMALKIANLRVSAALNIADQEQSDTALSGARKCQSLTRLRAMLELAKSNLLIADYGDWDTNPFLLGVPNGVVDLRTATLRVGIPEDRITFNTGVEYDPNATAPNWEKFLLSTFGGDEELLGYVHRAFGYSLTGSTDEQVIFLPFGSGANGKSTLIDALKGVAGEYGYNLPFTSFDIKNRSSIPSDIAALPGRRFVTAVEAPEGISLDEAKIKSLTGGDLITARDLYGKWETFRPMAKIWLVVNHLPLVSDDSAGMRRRLVVIPFDQDFSQNGDPKLGEKLREEAKGILAWLIKGAMLWNLEGLGTSARIDEATSQFKSDIDFFGRFLDEKTVDDPDGSVPAKDLREAYQDWARDNGERDLSAQILAARLKSRGFKNSRDNSSQRNRIWTGLRLKNPGAQPSRWEDDFNFGSSGSSGAKPAGKEATRIV
jgi:putative DNA primase/helicase